FMKPVSPADSPQLAEFKAQLPSRIVNQWISIEQLLQIFPIRVARWLATDHDETSGWVRAREYNHVKAERDELKRALDDEVMHREVYTYLFNKLNPFDDIQLTRDFLAQLGSRPLTTMADVMTALSTLLRKYVCLRIAADMRAYFAYQLRKRTTFEIKPGVTLDAHFRVGISSSADGPWEEGLPIGKKSNVYKVWRSKAPQAVSDATKFASNPPNQAVPGEGSVVGAPVIYDNHCVGVVGISSPRVRELSDPHYLTLSKEMAVIFSSLFFAYGAAVARGRRSSDPARKKISATALRNQIADYFS
ncbi:MAG TPA: hypothetical protein VHL59_05285, partial [Thermoanaerobaculia bacterium]|nr:hypothetical protein [Thermoanaerobaculia bacterium]